MFVTCVLGRMLWWLYGVGESFFSRVIVVLCVVHKCWFVLVVSLKRLTS